jgi:carboxyl-terminal processing protease
MKRLFSCCIFFALMMISVVPVAQASPWQLTMLTPEEQALISQLSARSGSVTRAAFLLEAVTKLYGEDIEYYSVPFTEVPRDARSAIGLARFVGALPQTWGSEEEWGAAVSRCQALEVLFALGQTVPTAGGTKQFRDVRSRTQQRFVEQALQWNLLQPFRPSMFGCGRALSAADLNILLEHFAVRINAPLPVSSVAPQATPGSIRSISAPSGSRGRSNERTITIELGGIDTGSRHTRRTKQELPDKDLLETVWGMIQSRFLYHEKINERETAYAIAEKMMALLDDQYSVFMRPSSAESFRIHLQGELTGIGAQVQSNAGGGVTVVSPLPGSPAMKAGVRPGDQITHVNGESILTLNLSDAVDKIRGPVGSKAELTIQREGGKVLITVIREKIVIPELNVSVQDNVMVLQIIQFGERTRTELMRLIEEGLAKNPQGIILDLRNDPGGLLDAAIDVASYFLPPDSVVARIRQQTSEREERTRPSKYIVPQDLPVVVLVNEGSASASEIVAGALQDYGRARIVGTKTFGKGTVQEVVSLPSGESIKITVAEWLTPNGNSIQDNGVTPDIVLAQEQIGTRDEQLLEAIRLVKAAARRRP